MNPIIPRSPRMMRPLPAKGRGGCLSNLLRLVVVLALVGVVMLAATAVFAPWGFYLGGKFHILPYWQGFGTLHAKSGRYVVFVRFEPKPSGSRVYPGPSVGGVGYLCTPRGEEFRMKLGGGMPRGIGANTDGVRINLYMYTWGAFSTFKTDHRPSIQLRGQWKNPNIVMDDDSSIYRGFNLDGTAYHGGGPQKPYNGEVVPVTLVPGSYSDFEAACKAR